VVVTGSGDVAAAAVLHFADHARSVTMVVPEASLADAAVSARLARAVEENACVTVRCGARIGEVRGYGRLEKVVVQDTAGGASQALSADGLYMLNGMVPRSDWVRDIVARDESGFVLTDAEMAMRPELLPASWPLDRPPLLAETSVPGVFAAGDVRAGSTKRVGSAVGQGEVAVAAINRYLRIFDAVEAR
jgi:thioredoxin reductase (NADPH)